MRKPMLKLLLLFVVSGSGAAMTHEGNRADEGTNDGQNVERRRGAASGAGHYGPADETYGDRWPHYLPRPPFLPREPCRVWWRC